MGLNIQLNFIDTRVPELEGDDVEILRIELWQAISELFSMTLLVRARASRIEMRDVVGRTVEVALFKDENRSQPEAYLPRVRGVIRRGHQLSMVAEGMSTYELVIVPSLWLTTLRIGHTIFNNSTAPEIVQRIVELYHTSGVTAVPRPRLPPLETRKREYTVRYHETDFNFIQRVLAEEGIAFFLGGEALEQFHLIADTTAQRSEVHATLRVLPSGFALHGDTDAILALEHGRGLRPGSHRYRDYFFDNHLFHPEGFYEDEGAVELIRLVGGGEYQEGILHEMGESESVLQSDDGRRNQARLRLEGRRRRHQILNAELTCPLPAGARLTITGDDAPVSEDHIVVRAVSIVESSDDAGRVDVQKTHRVECIPADYPYRPPHLPKPRIHGIQRGTVVGSEEIDVDEHGRVLVLFHWDLRNHDNPWRGPPDPFNHEPPTRRIQVAQDWAGPSRGFVTFPRLGDEVVIAYVDGDPDEPVIVGRLYNGLNRAAVKLPADRTQSVWRSRSSPQADGFHEIRFEDRVGAEELHIEAQRLHTRLVKGSEQIDVGGDRNITVGGHQTMEIQRDLDVHARNITERADEEHKIVAGVKTIVLSPERVEKTGGLHLILANEVHIQAESITLLAGSTSVIKLEPGRILIDAPIVDINP